MLQKALQWIKDQDQGIVTETINGRLYSRHKLLRLSLPEETEPGSMTFNTLQGLKDFAMELAQDLDTTDSLFFHVESATKVALCGQLQSQNFNNRFEYARSICSMEPFCFSRIGAKRQQNWLNIEEFVIALQSLFVLDDSREQIIDLLSHLANEKVIENKDDKFTQSLQIRTGISQKSNVPVKNPVILCPYRTFPEVDQPYGSYILRYREGQGGIECALFDADGGQWQLAAMKSIKAFLESEDIKAIA